MSETREWHSFERKPAYSFARPAGFGLTGGAAGAIPGFHKLMESAMYIACVPCANG